MTLELRDDIDRIDFACPLPQQLERISPELLEKLISLRNDPRMTYFYLAIRMHLKCSALSVPQVRIGGPEANFSTEMGSCMTTAIPRLLWLHRLARKGYVTWQLPETLLTAAGSVFLERLFEKITLPHEDAHT